ncbi:AraC family transcriptional regulator [Hymenobacter sp. 15J16-1T3B]|uniref:helix-turn-helix domain-containing protein n=1 Tax=Hymenobacter sp. 15J16-1T3B TaxID=2886941 RepID=UPI001D10777F|nr:helix-turn-helix domain-containing protein [Hymenobacter sp. 15J16-1T3B]MCC3159772.1 AraC family transcriptional regulator [Hymenobacter sp. 15J16-1T3B]
MTMLLPLAALRHDNQLFQLRELGLPADCQQWQHQPAHSVLWIREGAGRCEMAAGAAPFAARTLLFCPPHQPFRLLPAEGTTLRGVALHFGLDFCCPESGAADDSELLFRAAAGPVVLHVDAAAEAALAHVVAMLREELLRPALAQDDMLRAYLRILLIRASRLRQEQVAATWCGSPVPLVLQQLEKLIEQHYHQKHTSADYADLLNLTPKTLAKLVRVHYRRTLTEVIQARIVLEAKRLLFWTNKSVKEIAFALGFNDPYYFSRFFKNTTSLAPQQYRRAAGARRLPGVPA